MPMSRRCMIFKKFHAWRNARACIKCSSWIVKEDGQEKKKVIYIRKWDCVWLYVEESERKGNKKMRKKWTSGWEKREKEKGKIKVLGLGN